MLDGMRTGTGQEGAVAATSAALTVGQVAADVGVTVRTLHHYDEIGLVRPSDRSHAGYRLYNEADLERLEAVVVYRRLGFPLEEVATLLAARGADRAGHLRRQRDAVSARLTELRDLFTAIDRALEKELTGVRLTKQEQRELFGESYSEDYAEEAQERWGESDQWKQSRGRTAGYTTDDWRQIKAEVDATNAGFLAAMQAGEPPTSASAMDAAEAHRRHIERWFYDLTPQFHRGLGDTYVSDPRFARTYEDLAPGLAGYVRDAIHANADRQEGPGTP